MEDAGFVCRLPLKNLFRRHSSVTYMRFSTPNDGADPDTPDEPKGGVLQLRLGG